MLQFPKISIVTPSFNQGKFIEETILSVIGQNYPNLEYIIIDGGSNDETINVIKKYESYISYWVSEPDKGQSHAINKGFSKATGDIFGWLNSDDLYMPNTLNFMAQSFNSKANSIYYGNCLHFNQGSTGIEAFGSDVINYSKDILLENVDYIIQPSSFWSSYIWEVNGPLREDIHYAFDWEWFLRAKMNGFYYIPLAKCLSMYRIHQEHKTGTGGEKRQQEILEVYKMYSLKYAKLYEMLLNEDILHLNFKTKLMRKVMGYLRIPNSKIDMLKYIKYNKYKDYTKREIMYAIYMF